MSLINYIIFQILIIASLVFSAFAAYKATSPGENWIKRIFGSRYLPDLQSIDLSESGFTIHGLEYDITT